MIQAPGRRTFLGHSLAGFVGSMLGGVSLPAMARASVPRAQILRVVPPAYRAAALTAGVPPRLLYGIALQESAMAFGEHVLPWLWTLNIRGTPHRYATQGDAVRALTHAVTQRGIRNVDCGPMQVNWRWHADKLISFERALNARDNLAVGADILKGHYQASHDWYIATGRYHHETDQARARDYAQAVFARLPALKEAV